jgi:molybdopterin converting factor small subunit
VRVRIELFGIARARAGRETVDVEATSLGDAVRALAALCPGLVPEVVGDGRLADGFVANLNGDLFVEDPATALAHGDVLLILGAQAGG